MPGRGAGRGAVVYAVGGGRPEHALRGAERRAVGDAAALPRQPRRQPASPAPALLLPPPPCGAVVAVATAEP